PPCSSGAPISSISRSSLSWRPSSTSSARWARPRGSRSRSMIARRRFAAPERSMSGSPAMPGAEGERWRVFLAIEIPDAVRQALSEPLEALQPLHESIRINPTEQMHLTLHFLGHPPRPVVEALPSDLAGVVSRDHRFGLMAQGVGAFPAITRPRVLWAGITGADMPRLKALQAELGGA